MSTIVYQELQSCNESYFTESKRLSLKLSTQRVNLPQFVELPQTCTKSIQDLSSKSGGGAYDKTSCSNMSGWSSIEALSCSHRESAEKELPVYVHPLVKKSSFALSQKSLEMCTESLGCETGSFFMESNNFFAPTSEARKPRPKLETKKEVNRVEFPPPLTTISGSNAIRVRPYREHGRLVIEAVSAPLRDSYLQVERCDGRLKLSLTKDIDLHTCSSDYEGDNLCDSQSTESNEPESCLTKEENKGGDLNFEEDKNGIKLELEIKMGKGQIQRPSRCKEGSQRNKRLISWEPFWVAT